MDLPAVQKMLDDEPELGAGDESKCLPGWIESFARRCQAGDGYELKHTAVRSLLHVLIAARQRTRRLVRERDELRNLIEKRG